MSEREGGGSEGERERGERVRGERGKGEREREQSLPYQTARFNRKFC